MAKPKPREGSFYGMPVRAVYWGETWLEGEEFCYSGRGDSVTCRRAYARFPDGKLRVVKCGLPDTYFSIPGRAKIAGMTYPGFLMVNTDTNEIEFHPADKPITRS